MTSGPVRFKMAKVNGWKRIGIIASVVRILGSGAQTLNVVENDLTKTASELMLSCEEAQNGRGSAECDRRSFDYLAETNKGLWIEVAAVALIPVPLGWGFTYLVLFLVRWVKRGFNRPL
jgi:hypothetical protein